jgi:cytolysin (calcineurin-like family phosphatase)
LGNGSGVDARRHVLLKRFMNGSKESFFAAKMSPACCTINSAGTPAKPWATFQRLVEL